MTSRSLGHPAPPVYAIRTGSTALSPNALGASAPITKAQAPPNQRTSTGGDYFCRAGFVTWDRKVPWTAGSARRELMPESRGAVPEFAPSFERFKRSTFTIT
jgi:hypothetical protein